tara:strand:- start:785 stop:3478 length:2694 start_codon:yes stop_codon:yes gene_type:complete
MASVCLPNARDLGKKIKKWAESPKVKQTFRDPYEAAMKLVESEFLMPLEEIGLRANDITKGQLRSYEHRLKELNTAISRGNLGNAFVTSFWQTSHQGKKDPVIGSVLRNMQRSDFYFREQSSTNKNLMQGIMGSIEKESISRGIISKMGIKTSGVQKEMKKLDDALQQAIVDYKNKDTVNTSEISKIQKEIDSYVSKTYLKVYDDLLWTVENDLGRIESKKFKSLSEKDKQKVREGKLNIQLDALDLAEAKTKDGSPLSKDMYNALVSYKTLMDGLYKQLKNGVDARIDSIIERMQVSKGDMSLAKLREVKKKLQDKLMPKYEGAGFYPHYTRDLHVDFMNGLMPHFDNIQTASNMYIKSKSGNQTLREVVDAMDNYVSNHVKGRTQDYQYSRNFLNSVTNYIHDVNRFNYQAFMDKHYVEGLTSVERIYKTDGNAKGYGENIVKYVTDLHTAANGDMNLSPKTRALMRTVLGFEFISKLGINPRGAARNWFQRLLDYVEWGPGQWKKAKEIINRMSGVTEESLEGELKKVGLLFDEVSPQLIESQVSAPASTFRQLSFNEQTGKHEFHKKGRLERVADKVGWAAGKASVLHRMAENSNRKRTFKIAWAQMYDWLDGPRYREVLKDKNPDITEKQIQNSIRSRARNYAINMTVLNHFDYAEYARSKWTRNPVGKFMLQFQHYSFEFFERNLKIMREAKHDVLSGNIKPGQDAQGMFKAYNMAKAYFLAPVLAAAITGMDFDNLIEHDTAERMKQLAVAFTGDEEEIKEAFYGKGPVIATFGGPITSDLIDIGVMMDFINLDEDGLLAKISGMEKYDPNTRSSKTSQALRILNTAAGRAYEQHIPQLLSGRIGWPIQAEFGLYPTAEARKRQKVQRAAREKILPKDLELALQALERRQ